MLVTFRGWAALNEDCSSVTGIFAMIDDGPPFEIVHGIERQDVAVELSDENYAMAGFRGIFTTSHLSYGTHSLRVAIRSADGALLDFAEDVSFTIVESPERQMIATSVSPISTKMAVDEVRIGPCSEVVPIAATHGDIVHLRGWAIDEPACSLAHAVYAVLGSSVFRADYGQARPDVASHYRDDHLINCGFALDIPVNDIPPGRYTIKLRVIGSGENVIYKGHHIAMDVSPFVAPATALPTDVPTLGNVDKIALFDRLGNSIDAQIPMTLVSGDQLFLSGWAIDERHDTLARAIQVCVDGLAVTSAVYGLNRRDVAQHFHRPDLSHCGFTALVPTASMPLGVHSAVVRVIDWTGKRFYELEQTIRFTVIENEP
jgi:hypothetical protein